MRFEIMERIDAQGTVLIKLDEEQVRATVKQAVAQGAEAIAILFLHSYRNPAHEQRVKQLIEKEFPGLFVTASHELSQEYREYERTSTAAANAYIGPRVRTYLTEMEEHLGKAGFGGNFLIVQSTGGLFDVEDGRRSCIRMLESGPAAGVIGTKALCDSIGMKNAIAFDMGGTTAKAGVIYQGDVLMTGGALIGGYATGLPIQMPMIDIQEVGTGGGSIARLELGNALRVGPESAGAAPGPVCYGLGGTEPTITDANLVLGRLGVDRFLGRRDAARYRSGEAGAHRQDREAARPRSHRGGGGHSPHRHHQDGARGALGDHRTRPRRRRLHAGRLRRRRAAARLGGGARAWHRQGGDPARAGALFRLRHAGCRPAPRFRQHLVHDAGRRAVRADGGNLRRHGDARPRNRDARADRSSAPARRAAPTCATYCRSTP